MSQEKEKSADEKDQAIIFTDNWDTVEAVSKDGVEVFGEIKTFQEKPDPNDDEHSIIRLEYEYEVNSQRFNRELEFSINIVHIIYGFAGGLTTAPKFKYSLEDFRGSMQPGQKLKIRTLSSPPFWFYVEFNEVMTEVMRHRSVWM